MDQTYSAEVAEIPPKKKRGRPRKSETVLLPGEVSALTKTPPSADQVIASKKIRVSSYGEASPLGENNHRSMVGQPVHGVVDGSFDAGYLVTVRIGDSDTVYRGVVFGPGLSIPLSRENDVATKVKNTNRDDAVPLSSPPSVSPTPAAPAPPPALVEGPRGVAGFSSSTGAVPGHGSAPSAFRSSFDQDMSNAGGFMYPGVSQIHPGHDFVPRAFGYPFRLPGADYASGSAQFEADAQGVASRGSS